MSSLGKIKNLDITKEALQGFEKLAVEASIKAGENSMKYFQKDFEVVRKPDRTPVTQADREAEEIIRELLRKSCSDHQIFGEEFGTDGPEDADFKWLIDPIDGTKQFVRGRDFWGSVLGLEYKGQMVVGVIYHPALKLLIRASKGMGCFANDRRCQVSEVSEMSEASVSFGGLQGLNSMELSKIHQLISEAEDHRLFGDCYGHSLVIQGFSDVMAEYRVSSYDISAIKVCIEEAGGRFSNLSGDSSIYSGSILTTNARLHDQALATLKLP